MSAPSLALGESEVVGAVGEPFAPTGWMLGGQTGRLASNDAEMNSVDADAEYAFSVPDGSRGRLKFSAPVSAMVYDGERGARFAGALRVGYEQPLLTHRWVVEPSAGVAVLGPQAEASKVLEVADAAMYVRKAQRRHERSASDEPPVRTLAK